MRKQSLQFAIEPILDCKRAYITLQKGLFCNAIWARLEAKRAYLTFSLIINDLQHSSRNKEGVIAFYKHMIVSKLFKDYGMGKRIAP